MTNILVLGGNGYIGKNLISLWLQKSSEAEFYLVSRSGKWDVANQRVHSIVGDVRNLDWVEEQVPNKIDYVINLVGRPENTAEKDKQTNWLPAQNALTLAGKYRIKGLGFVQGKLGPKRFIQTKADIASEYQDSGLPVVIVNPTLVIGGGHDDFLSKIAPVFKLLGFFSSKLKPISVDNVVNDLIDELVQK